MAITSYPLSWPPHFPRSKRREPSRFSASLQAALGNVQTSLIRFARDSETSIDNVVISSNVTLGHDLPRDPGIAIWFEFDRMQVCIPVDRYSTVEANLQAVHHILEARRVELRHGSLEIVKASFKGFLLAAPSNKPWFEVLGVSERAPIEAIRKAYRKKIATHHPDRRGGNDSKMAEINLAWDEARNLNTFEELEETV